MQASKIVLSTRVVLALCSALALASASVAAFSHGMTVAWLALHLVSVPCVGWGLYDGFLPRGRERAFFWAAFGSGLSLMLPALGPALMVLLCLALRFVPPAGGNLLQEFSEHLAPASSGGPAMRRRAPDLALVEHLQVEPLIDMLETDDSDLKRAVIDAMAKRRGRKLIIRIQGCLSDPRPEIYQYAMAKLSKLQEDFTKAVARATNEIEEHPDEPSSHLQLARIYAEYLESGLVEETLLDFYRGRLLEEYDAVLALDPAEPATSLARAHLLLDLGRAEEAAGEFRRVLERDDSTIEARFGMVQACYEMRHWGAMQSELAQLLLLGATRAGVSNPSVIEIAHWLRGDVPTAGPAEEVAIRPARSRPPSTRLKLPPIQHGEGGTARA